MKHLDTRTKSSRFSSTISNMHSYSGLSVMDSYFDRFSLQRIDKPELKICQMKEFVKDVDTSRENSIVLCALSNDYKSFLSVPKLFFVYNLGEIHTKIHLREFFEKFGKISNI